MGEGGRTEGVSLPSLSPHSFSHLDINTVLSIDVNYYNLRSFHLLQNASLFQKAATIVTECVSYHKMRRHYKMPQPLLQNA